MTTPSPFRPDLGERLRVALNVLIAEIAVLPDPIRSGSSEDLRLLRDRLADVQDVIEAIEIGEREEAGR